MSTRTITDIPLPEVAERKTRAKQMPVLEVGGDTVQRYNAASDQKKKAVTAMQALKPKLVIEGLKYIFEHNSHAQYLKNRIQSVRLKQKMEDPDEEAELCTFTLADRPGKLDRARIDAAFASMKRTDGRPANPNDYVEWAVVPQFDPSLFFDNEGNWVQSRYDKVQKALMEVAKELKCFSPLSCAKELRVKPEFFQLRYTDFTVSQNMKLTKVIPCTASLEPMRGEVEEEEK